MMNEKRQFIKQHLAPGIILGLTLVLITLLVYYAESRRIAYYPVFRYLYVIPIASAALRYGLAMGFGISLLCTSLFLPILARIVVSEGASNRTIELAALLMVFNLLAYLVGDAAGHLRRQKELYKALNHLSEHLDRELQFNQLLATILTQVLETIPAQNGEIVLLDEQTGQLRIAAHQGTHLSSISSSQELNLARWILITGRSFLSNNVSADPLFATNVAPDSVAWPRSLIAVPLQRGREPFGLICLMDRKDGFFSETDLLLLESIADKSETGIENARLYHAMEQSELRYRTLFRGASDGIFLIDPESGDILDVNPQAERLTGHAGQELIGLSATDLSPSQHPDLFQIALRQINGVEETAPEETKILRKDGQTISVEAKARRIELDEKTVYLVNARDISRRKELEKQLLQAEKLSALGQLVSGVAHELNNPLTSITGYAQLTLEVIQDPQARSDLERILEEAERSARIVKNLLTFARQHRPEKRLVNVNQVIESVLNLQVYQLRVDNIVVTTDLDENVPPILLDSYQIQQVLFNIIANAHHAMANHRGSGHLHVASQFARNGAVLWIIIRDDGPGIPPEIVDRIFDPFFTTKDVGEGTGLGLSICFGIMKEHDGDIWVESEVGQGTTFFVELPIRPTTQEIPATEAPIAMPNTTFEGKRILVVDDEQHILNLLSRLLSREGCIVETASNGDAAASRLAEQNWDLIISDVKMPSMDGRRLYAHVLASQPELAKRIIFTTGDTANVNTLGFLAELGRPYLRKPFLTEAVKKIVAQALKD
jgi:two-component system NtrC family sensor kinase